MSVFNEKLPALFVPICLYTTSFYSKKRNIHLLLTDYVQKSVASLILICDDLHAYNLLIRLRTITEQDAFTRANNYRNNVHAMLSKALARHKHLSSLSISRWQELSSSDGYQQLYRALQDEMKVDQELTQIVDGFVFSHVRRFDWRLDPDALRWERRYLLEEITMSIYATEFLGYHRELWEAPPNESFPDPLGFLYSKRSTLIKSLIGRQLLHRKLEFIHNK